MKSIIIIIDFLGEHWPEWFPLFLESCRKNPDINWLFHTDCPVEGLDAGNIMFKPCTREDYIRTVNQKLNVRFDTADPYKLCDLRPAYGVLYEEEIKDYDFFGYGDIDVIYGRIRDFYTDDILNHYNIISTHTWCISGHLALIRNEEWLRKAFYRISNWQEILEKQHNQRFDEDYFSSLFLYPAKIPRGLHRMYDWSHPSSVRYRKNVYFVEQHTTPLTPGRWKDGNPLHPTVWYWKDGHITNDRDGDERFLYLHFMNFKHARYMSPAYGRKAFWDGMSSVVHINPEHYGNDMRIDPYGFTELIPKQNEGKFKNTGKPGT